MIEKKERARFCRARFLFFLDLVLRSALFARVSKDATVTSGASWFETRKMRSSP
jgi:hypothetical protein